MFKFNKRWSGAAILLAVLVSIIPAGIAFAGTTSGGDSDFYGTIQALPGSGLVGDWKVNARTVHVSATTIFEPNAAAMVIGAYVEVKGTPQPDGSINATEIELKAGLNDANHVKFIGVIKSLPAGGLIGDWTVMGQILTQTITATVHVSSATKIEQEDGAAAVGATVKIEGMKQSDGSINAGEIEVLKGAPAIGNQVEFLGKVEAMSGSGLIGDWTINGRTVHVTAQTKVEQEHGKAAVGATVKVEGILQADGSVNAKEIEVRVGNGTPPPPSNLIKFYGMVNSMPGSGTVGTWQISGLTVNVSATTVIEHGPASVGSNVEVKGVLQSDGSVNAVKIEVKTSTSKPTALFGPSSAFTSIGK